VVFSDRSPHELAPSPSPTRALLPGSAVDLVDVADIGVEQAEVIGCIPGEAVCLGTPDVLTGCTFSRGSERVNSGRRSPVVTVDRNRKDVPTNLVDVRVQVRPVWQLALSTQGPVKKVPRNRPHHQVGIVGRSNRLMR